MMFLTVASKVDRYELSTFCIKQYKIIAQNQAEDICYRQSKEFLYPPSQFSLKTLEKIDLPDWYIFLYAFCQKNVADISSTFNSTRFNMSVIFLIGLLLSNSLKISSSNPIVISEIVLLFTEKVSNASCWPISRETKSFLSSLTRGIISLHSKNFREDFSHKNFCVQKVWSKINQAVPRPPLTSYAYSQAKHFFSSIS